MNNNCRIILTKQVMLYNEYINKIISPIKLDIAVIFNLSTYLTIEI